MPQGINSVIKVDLKAFLLSEEIHNVFHYRAENGIINQDLPSFSTAFLDEVVEKIRNCTSTQITYQDMTITNLHSGETLIVPIVLGGTRTGEVLPAFMAWGFTLQRSSTDVRNGAKRFAGIVESDINDGLATSAIRAVLDTLGLAMSTNLVTAFPDNFEYTPIILRKDFPFLTTYTYSTIYKGLYRRVTTQNSRKSY